MLSYPLRGVLRTQISGVFSVAPSACTAQLAGCPLPCRHTKRTPDCSNSAPFERRNPRERNARRIRKNIHRKIHARPNALASTASAYARDEISCRGFKAWVALHRCVQMLPVAVPLLSAVTVVLHVIAADGCTTFENEDPSTIVGVVASHALGQPLKLL